ncbi:YkgJ family cysteine cluster protein [Desulfatitalea alkaliphila]|uniref:YkgJ family cysteine cluster protein n=1 Tax=Desulfatitalea alkaliphila TaxID=2929485 RepID=A0AA41R0A3_9BACT|nr:YkgJ family cysteine cluster protein [Desulfatitalea alkaliphila]MCJ8499638.1 YkgJ family cysteine cluster protein [Desulfatitalea alkaliphila]
MDPERLVLNPEQALNAICLDFRGYGPQPMLFCEVLRAIHGEAMVVRREPGSEGLWIAKPGSGKMRHLEGAELVAFMCDQVRGARLPPERLAVVSRQVFQTACRVVTDPATDAPAIAVDTGMATFACRQCGRCCRHLDYRDGITEADVARLRALDRQDILEWVGVAKGADGRNVYRIWVEPGTNRFAVPCPFLKRGPTADRWLCRIHAVKPEICRHYPVSRKHAAMTGCPGFDRR